MFRFQDEFCTVTTSLPANTPIVEKQKHPRTSKCISNKSIKKYRIVIFLRACRMKVFFSQFSPIAVSCVWTEFKYSFCNDHCVRPPEPGPPPAPPRHVHCTEEFCWFMRTVKLHGRRFFSLWKYGHPMHGAPFQRQGGALLWISTGMLPHSYWGPELQHSKE